MRTISDAFRKIADEIDHNEASDFAGAFCIVAPAIEGEQPRVLRGLYLDSDKSGAAFWGIIGGRIKVVMDEIGELERKGQAFRR